MSDPVRFLQALAHALSTIGLYPEGHPTRERAVEAAYEPLADLIDGASPAVFTMLDDEVVYGREPLRELRGWGWARRLVETGIQRLEFDPRVTRQQFDGFVQELFGRLVPEVAPVPCHHPGDDQRGNAEARDEQDVHDGSLRLSAKTVQQ